MAIVDARGVPLERYATALTYVLLDIENCSIPQDCDAATVPATIKASLREKGYRGPIKVIAVAANENHVLPSICQVLRANKATLITLNSHEKQVSDDHIRRLIKSWTATHHSPANVMLISGDGGFAPALRHLERRGYNVLLAYIPHLFQLNFRLYELHILNGGTFCACKYYGWSSQLFFWVKSSQLIIRTCY